jgi:RimJ/RimL family protein N-acetyltransferase
MKFDPQPTLRGELLELRPLREDDFQALYAVASDPLIWEQHPNPERSQEGPFRVFFRDALDSGGALLALKRADGQVIGTSRYDGFTDSSDEIEIGYTFLARACWGGRYNGEMKRLMLAHAFECFRSVALLIGPENHRSQRAAEKIGAVRSGTRLQNGALRVVYRIAAPGPRSSIQTGA